ncbi:MAG: hypothetical protein HXY48_06420 [Ignavibacteriaceae bacterium]|nr:hypothetical protein [Ignavibacteriaceae bacterium]
MTQHQIRLKLVNGKIEVKPSGPDVRDGDEVRFYVESGDNETFEVLFHNPEDFFSNCNRICSFTVNQNADEILTVQQPNNNIRIKYYSVCVIMTSGAQPLPPDAPPRIIRYT